MVAHGDEDDWRKSRWLMSFSSELDTSNLVTSGLIEIPENGILEFSKFSLRHDIRRVKDAPRPVLKFLPIGKCSIVPNFAFLVE